MVLKEQTPNLHKTRGVVGWERRSHTSFRRGNAFQHLFALATLLADVGSKRLH